MEISFYLQNRSDDVDVYVVDSAENVVATLASGVHMVGGRSPVRRGFHWDGRLANGQVAPDGVYYIKVSLIHQGRSVLISSPSSGALPVTVDTVAPHPRVVSVTPGPDPANGRTRSGRAHGRYRSTSPPACSSTAPTSRAARS